MGCAFPNTLISQRRRGETEVTSFAHLAPNAAFLHELPPQSGHNRAQMWTNAGWATGRRACCAQRLPRLI